MSHHQTMGKNHYIKIANKAFESVAQFVYFGNDIKKSNCIHNRINSRLNSGNSCYNTFFYMGVKPGLSR
jgi:hypothetical protein